MFDLGDQITLGSNGIAWLIWIQFFILFLLFLLLLHFGLFALNSAAGDSHDGAAITSSGVLSIFGLTSFHDASPAVNSSPRSQVRGNLEIEREITTSSTGRRDEISERDRKGVLMEPRHPCYYLELAKKAFLGCLGLGFSQRKCWDNDHEE